MLKYCFGVAVSAVFLTLIFNQAAIAVHRNFDCMKNTVDQLTAPATPTYAPSQSCPPGTQPPGANKASPRYETAAELLNLR